GERVPWGTGDAELACCAGWRLGLNRPKKTAKTLGPGIVAAPRQKLGKTASGGVFLFFFIKT
ncbi:hypothetical protein ACVGW8_00135, partial [Enterobacter hormaechei]